MKTTSTTTKMFAAFAALVLAFGSMAAQNLRPQENWLQAWKDFAGTQHSAAWLQDEIANGASLFSDVAHDALVLNVAADLNTMDAVAEALAEGIQAGNGNQMSAGADAEMLDHTTAVTTWAGTLGGKQLYATVVAQLQQSGGTQLVIALSRVPMHDTHAVRKTQALALLDALGAEAQESPLVSESK